MMPFASVRKSLTKILFWGSVDLVIYTYFLFPLLTVLRGKLFPRPLHVDQNDNSLLPTVSLLIAAYNEADVIQAKLENAVALDYPADKLEIIVVSDGSDDGTNEIVTAFPSERVRLLALPRQGKNSAVNTAVSHARHAILVFTDADSMLNADALTHLMQPLLDPDVGGAAGDYHYQKIRGKGDGERAYWDFDRQLKQMQSLSGSISSATGQIYAIRRELFQTVPPTVTDDAYISRTVLAAHKRLVFVPEAVARGPIADASGEYRRKVRITTRGLNCVWQQRHLLNPLRYGMISWQLFSHKVLRRVMALPLLVTAVTAPLLWSEGWFYRLAALAQTGLHGAALLGWLADKKQWKKIKLLTLPYHFDMVNIATLVALKNLVRGTRFDVWMAERG
jgi:cellulose synthase/poly-beta-1,6-N-acetylglucosamine synthase-like glycosyltransferase